MKVVLEELESRRPFSRAKARQCTLAAIPAGELSTLPLRHDLSRPRRLPPRVYGKWIVAEFIVVPTPVRHRALTAIPALESSILPLRQDPSCQLRLPPRAYGKCIVAEFIIMPAPARLCA